MPYPRRSPYTPQRDPGRYTSTITDLIQRGGDIQAQNAAIQGDIWGNAIQDVGQIAGQATGQYFEQKEQEDAIADRDAKLTAFFRNFSEAPPKEFAMGAVEGFGPEMGIQLTEGWFGLQQSAMEMREAQEALQAGEEERAEKHRQIAIGKLGPVHRVLMALGGVENPVVAEMLETTILPLVNQGLGLQLTHEQLRQPGMMEAIGQEVTEAEKLMERDPSKQLVSPTTGEVVSEATPEVDDPLDQRLKELKVAQAEKDLRAGPGGSASFTPKVVTVAGSETPILVNYNSKTGKYHDVDTNEVLTGVGPEIEMDTEAEQTKALGRFMDELKGLSRDLIKDRGLWQRAKASGMSIENFLLTKPDYKIYRDTRKALAAALAKRFDPRPSNFDIEHVWIPMLPDVFTDSPDSREGKWRALNRMAGLAEEEDTSAESQGIPEIPEAALEGLDDTERDIVNSVVRGSR